MDWDKASQELAKDLDRKRDDEQIIKTRPGGGGKELSYIEGWWAIAEANRIFGHGGWSRATTELKLITEKPVGYFAKVRVTVGDVVRDGCGWGSDLRGDHEKALKEAETDATKRALMTFGWPFGLALYDKTQEHVSDGEQPNYKPEDVPLGMVKGDGPTRFASHPLSAHLQDEMKTKTLLDDLQQWWVEKEPSRKRLNSENRHLLFMEFMKQGFELAPAALDLRVFLRLHKDNIEALEKRSQKEYEGLLDHYDKAKARFQTEEVG